MHDLLLVLILLPVAGIAFIWWTNRVSSRNRANLHQEIRDSAEDERDKQLREARENGHFDRWSNDKTGVNSD